MVHLQHQAPAVTARLHCYTDSAAIAVNPQVAGATACPPAAAMYCGNGSVGAAPPGRSVAGGQINFADVDDQHAQLAGQLSSGSIALAGCIEDRDGAAALGHLYVSLTIDAHTGEGQALLYPQQTGANCTGGTPTGSPAPVPASLVRQSLIAQQHDFDVDGCPDQRELTNNAGQGGLRDPRNHYDYFNPTQDGVNRVDDILAVVNQYFLDDPPGQPDMGSLTDRTGILGGNPWNLGPPNGQQRVDDILGVVKQYFHDC
jgi:hypothetical protein